jgi:cell division protein FtsL
MTYSQAISSTKSNREKPQGYRRNQNTTVYQSSKASIGPVSNILIMVIIVCLLGVIYLTQVTKTYALGYRINDLSSEKSELNDEKSRLELESVKLQSVERVKNSKVASKLETVSPSNYAE